MSEKPAILSATDLAKKAGVAPSYIARLCRTGRLPASKLGGTWMIRAEDAEAWLAKRGQSTEEN